MADKIPFDNIRAEISRRRWSIDEFCEKIGIGRKTFYNWEEKGDFSISYLIKMSELFGVSTDELLGIDKTA